MMSRAISAAYHYGRQHDRSWALRYLAVLFRNNPTQGRILAHLAALSLPQSVVRGLRQMGRRAQRPSTAAQMEDYSG
jgi:hypothetical protein